MAYVLQHAFKRVAAAYATVPAELASIHASTWVYIATFAAIVLPLGVLSGVLHLKVEKRPAKWLEVRWMSSHNSRQLLQQ